MSGAGTDLLRIARVLKSNGTDGEILIGFRDACPEDLNLKEPVFIEFDGLPVPFFIESFKAKGANKALLHVTGVRNLKDAEELVGKEVFSKAGDLPDFDDEDGGLVLYDLAGWTILDESGVRIGEVSDFEDIPGNPCLYVNTENGQAMIPLNEDFILSVDESAKELIMRLPEGLI